jgi:hypothetical protein
VALANVELSGEVWVPSSSADARFDKPVSGGFINPFPPPLRVQSREHCLKLPGIHRVEQSGQYLVGVLILSRYGGRFFIILASILIG